MLIGINWNEICLCQFFGDIYIGILIIETWQTEIEWKIFVNRFDMKLTDTTNDCEMFFVDFLVDFENCLLWTNERWIREVWNFVNIDRCHEI